MIRKLKYGIGINDADYNLRFSVYTSGYTLSGRRKTKLIWKCPYYSRWEDMLKRCYSSKFHREYPTYIGCSVSEDWLRFSSFKKWMVTQAWEGSQLDKDFLVSGNQLYSKDTCIFIDSKVNSFIESRGNGRGDLLLGCYLSEGRTKFTAQCSNPLELESSKYISTEDTEIEAHLAWKKRKHQYACDLADSIYVTDDRIRDVLLTRYKNYTIVEDHLK